MILFLAIFALIHFPIMASKFLQIRQKSQLDQLTALAQQLTTTCITFRSFDQNSSTEIPPSTPPPPPLPPASFYSRKQQQLEQIWRQTVLLNRAYAVLCADIATASRFWSPFLSIFLLEHITLQAYMAYIVFIIRTLPFTQKLFFLYALIEVEALLFLLINRCAQIVKLNQKVERVNAQVYLKLFTRNLDNGRRENKVVHRVILKVSGICKTLKYHL